MTYLANQIKLNLLYDLATGSQPNLKPTKFLWCNFLSFSTAFIISSIWNSILVVNDYGNTTA